MTSIKLEEKQIEIGGKVYTLHVNMSVLDRLQEANGGEIGNWLKKPAREVVVETMAVMLNDWAEDHGWEEEWTPRKVKKTFTLADIRELDVLGMLSRAMNPPKKENTKEAEPAEETGN